MTVKQWQKLYPRIRALVYQGKTVAEAIQTVRAIDRKDYAPICHITTDAELQQVMDRLTRGTR